ncbi:MAG: hypothetical protein JOY59_12065 [Candidatus Eremiobacteraeota bacterium]|nr:hypothetical protein [Candidatus Eremiobacteraeota bacterium]
MMATSLSDVGMEYRAVTLAEAVAACAAHQVDALLIDVMQSSADVLKLLQAAAPAKTAGFRIPVIVMAPATARDRVQACLQHGAEDYLFTPLDPKNTLLVTRRIGLVTQKRPESLMTDTNSDVLNRFIPHEFLETLGRTSLGEVKLGDNVQKNMTVFFSDIRDFTTLSEELTPQQNFNFLNSYLQHANPIIHSHKGFIDKYIGDASMALFPRNSTDALEAALDLQREVVKYNAGRQLAGYVPIRIGIGIHRGDLIMGTIGEEQRLQTTVIADAVNLASRLEGLTKTFGVSLLISGSVVEGLEKGHTFLIRHLGGVKAKGKTQSVEIYECYDNDPAELLEHKKKTADAFASAMSQFRSGMFLSAGRIFARIAESMAEDAPAAYYRDRCTLTAVHDRGPGAWDGAEKMEVK